MWFLVEVQDDQGNTIFTIPLQAPMQNSVQGRFEEFLRRNPELESLLEKIGNHKIVFKHKPGW